MKIHLDYRNPTPTHCDVAVFVNGALAGVLTLRQEELDSFQGVIAHGLTLKTDEFLGTGDPGPGPDWHAVDAKRRAQGVAPWPEGDG